MTATKTTRVFIVEDHNNLRRLLQEALAMLDDLKPCGSAATAEEAIEMMKGRTDCPDLALIDLSLPGKSGLELIEELQRERNDVRCVVLSGIADREMAEAAIRAGARGYILKGKPWEMIEGMRAVVNGEVYISPEITE